MFEFTTPKCMKCGNCVSCFDSSRLLCASFRLLLLSGDYRGNYNAAITPVLIRLSNEPAQIWLVNNCFPDFHIREEENAIILTARKGSNLRTGLAALVTTPGVLYLHLITDQSLMVFEVVPNVPCRLRPKLQQDRALQHLRTKTGLQSEVPRLTSIISLGLDTTAGHRI